MPVVYGDITSGNCYKVALLLTQLRIPFGWRETLVTDGDTRTVEFSELNPAGQIPVVVLDDGTVLTQSNAILHYFATGSSLIPEDTLSRTRLLEWQFFEQYSHEPNIAVRRFIKKYLGLPDDRKAEFEAREAGSYRALDVLEHRLSGHRFLVGDHYSLADISLFAYTHVASEADIDLSRYQGVNRWLDVVRKQPLYIGMYD